MPAGFQAAIPAVRQSDSGPSAYRRASSLALANSPSLPPKIGSQPDGALFALFGGPAEPSVGFHLIHRHICAGQIQQRQADLRRDEALEGGLPEPLARPLPGCVVVAQLELGGGVVLGGGDPDPAQGGPLVRWNPLASRIAYTKFELGAGVPPDGTAGAG